jgi:RNA-directed DNA polymerase
MRSTRRTSSASRTGSDPAKRFDQLWLTPTKRRGRGQHDALDALAVGIENRAVNWILDADTVVGFEHRSDAERFLADLRDRMAEFALELHPEKTRLIEFGKHALSDRAGRVDGKPETFDFLGFTHICARWRQGSFVLARHTRRDRTMAKLLEVVEDLRHRWHQDIAEQGCWLGTVVRGYFAYHALPMNMRALSAFRDHVTDLWRRALRRPSERIIVWTSG